MQLVERHIIRRIHKHWQEIDGLAFLSKNLYNAANYICRQHFFETGNIYSLPSLYQLIKNSPDYRALPTKVSKQIIKRLASTWVGYKNAHKEWTRHPEKFLGEPKIPKYKHKTQGRNTVIYHHESVYKKPLKQGICHLSMSGIQIPTKVNKIVEVRLVPQSNCYVIEIVYQKDEPECTNNNLIAGLDLGLSNLVALSSNKKDFRPILINGRPLKSINQFYNKCRAKLQRLLPKEQKTSHRIRAITAKRNRYVENYLHQVSSKVVSVLNKNNIKTLVIGKNDNWKQCINIGRRNNQQFTQIPHAKLIDKLRYKCQLAGIQVIVTEESYTSKTSALDLEEPIKQSAYKGKRVKRGLFKSAEGILINADINGSAQIIRKVFPNAFANGIERLAVSPLMVNPL